MSKGTVARATGTVTFVGVGPGDLGLLTVKGIDALGLADAVLYESGLHVDVAGKYAPDTADLTAVVDPGGSAAPAIRAKRIIKAAKTHEHVVRLLDGDAATFAGLAEEAHALHKEGIRFEVVPGVSAPSAIATYSGVSLTTNTVKAVHVVHAGGNVSGNIVSSKRASTILVGDAGELADAAEQLALAGWADDTGVVVTVDGTRSDQVSVATTLGQLASELATLGRRRELGSSVHAMIGPGTASRAEFSWYESKSLFGWKVLIPRTKDQSASTIDKIREHGGVPTVVPTISVEPPRTPQQMEKAVKGMVTGRYEWVGFTSVNAVRAVKEKFTEFGLDARAFAGLKIAAVGGVTAGALRDWGIEPDLVPTTEQSAHGLLADWPPFDPVLDPVGRVFLPRADIATDTLVAGLQENGWEVDDVTAYRTVRAAPPAAPIRESIKNGTFDAVLFTSSSTVRNLVGIAGKPHASTVIACIGPATAKTAEEHGLRVDVLAGHADALTLVDGLADFAQSSRESALAAGEPALRPSQRKGAARRRAR